MNDIVTEFAASAFTSAIDGASWIGREILKHNLVQAFAVVSAAVYGSQLAKHRIERGRLSGHSAIVGETFYTPSGEINPFTAQEFYDQKLRTYEATLDLRSVFHPSVAPRLMKFLDAASKRCTVESPIVFSHLEEVVPAKEFPRVWEMVTRQWRNHFSESLNERTNPQSLIVGERERMIEKTKIPLLVYEESSVYKQYRVLLVPVSYASENALPHINDTRVEVGQDFVYDRSHYLYDRLRTNEYIAKAMREDPKWLRDFGVKFMTGESYEVPKPDENDRNTVRGINVVIEPK